MTPVLPISTALLVLAATIGVVLLLASIRRLIAVVRGSVLARVPALDAQEVTLATSGTVVLWIEAPHFSTAFAGVDFGMLDAAGRALATAPILFRTRVSGASRVRLGLRTFEVPHAGRYRVVASGIPPGRDMSQASLVFARPATGSMIVSILGIVLGGILLIAGGVLTVLRYAGKL
jgi:hypothetical protein